MTNESKEIIVKIQATLEQILRENKYQRIEVGQRCECNRELKNMIRQINVLINNLEEVNEFALELSKGNLDIDTPPRSNYIAGSLKQLHSKLGSLLCSMKQLTEGYIVSKFEYDGDLFETFNDIVDVIAEKSILYADSEKLSPKNTINSWRYHQILKTLDMIHVIIVEIDHDGRVVYYNNAAREAFGDMDKFKLNESENEVLRAIIVNQNNIDFPIVRDVYESKLWYRITTDCFTFPNGKEFYFNVIENISEWKLRESNLEQKNKIDEMTGTFNRKDGIEELERILYSEHESYNCLAFMDIDGLKLINDEYGHTEGDFAIKAISRIFLDSVRESDIVCRYGGDEFFIIFKDCIYDEAKIVIERMHNTLSGINNSISKPYQLSFSYGLISFSNQSGTAMEILNSADEKMYIHKSRKYREEGLLGNRL